MATRRTRRAFVSQGEAATLGESTASPRHIHRDLPPWRDADLWQSGRFRRGRYRLRFQEHAAAQKIGANAAASPAGGTTPQPETTFAPVPSYTSRATSKPAAPKKPPPPEIHPNKAATRTGARLAAAARAAAVEQSAAGGTSVDGGQPPRRRLARPAAAIFRLHGEHPAADDAAAQYAHAGNRAAAAAAARRGRSLRGARHPRRLVPVAAVARSDRRLQHQSGACHRLWRRSLFYRRAGAASPFRLGTPLAHRRHHRLLHRIRREPRALAQRSLSQCQDRRSRRRHPRHSDPSRSAFPHQHRQSGQPQPRTNRRRNLRNCRSTSTSARRSAWRRQFNRLSFSLSGTFDRSTYDEVAPHRRRDFEQRRP